MADWEDLEDWEDERVGAVAGFCYDFIMIWLMQFENGHNCLFSPQQLFLNEEDIFK